MSKQATENSSPNFFDNGLRYLSALVIFAVLGPPIGGLIIALPLLFFRFMDRWPFELQGMGVVVVFSYLPGVFPALASGAVVGFFHSLKRPVTWSAILWANFFASLVLVWVVLRGALTGVSAGGLVAAYLLCLLPTTICALVVRWTEKFWRRVEALR